MRVLGFLLIGLFSSTATQALPEFGVVEKRDWSFEVIGAVPVQGGGRVKPLDSFAREAAVFVTGRTTYEGWHPIDLVLSFVTNPDYWRDQRIIKVRHKDVKKQLLLDGDRIDYSPQELFSNSVVGQYASEMMTGETQAVVPGEMKQNPRENDLKQLIQKIFVFRQIITGEAWLVFPSSNPSETAEVWGSLERLKTNEPQEIGSPEALYKQLITAYLKKDEASFNKVSLEIAESVGARAESQQPGVMGKVKAEAFYNRFKPYQWTWILYLIAGLLLLAAFVWKPEEMTKLAWAGLTILILGFCMNIAGMAVRTYIAGRPPVSNMYESVVWVGFGTVFFGLIIYAFKRNLVLPMTVALLASLTLLVGDSAPAVMDPSIQPLVPVLRSNLWLTVHVLTITISYSAFAVAFGLGVVTVFYFIKNNGALSGIRKQVDSMNDLIYRAIQIGVVLLAAGTILGGVWADYSWGRFWGWDPKEVWALIALLAYLAVLHGRLTGWVGTFNFSVLAVVSFLTVIMAWYGVNFILGAGLHTYGFSAGGFSTVCAFVGAVTLYVGYAYLLVLRQRDKKSN